MTLFVGGPYHGRELPIEPLSKVLRLPQENQLEAYLGVAQADPGATNSHTWPFLYELDKSTDQPFYRFLRAE